MINALHHLFWALGGIAFAMGVCMLPDDAITDKTAITWGVFGMLFMLIAILLPSREIMYQMLASKIVTKDVAVKGLDYINNVVGQLLTR